jgi:spectinomycin phosphotransferase
MHELQQFLRKHYPLEVRSIDPAPRQFVAETFVATAADGQRFFVKRFPPGRLPRHALESLPVLRALYDAGLTQINVPLVTRSSELHARDGDATVVVFNYIDAPQTFEYDMGALGTLLARLHQQRGRIPIPISLEPFRPPYAAEWHDSLEQAAITPTHDTVVDGLQRVLDEYGAELQDDWAAFERVAEQCRRANLHYVITHGDAPGNVLKDAHDNIFLVDWDEILLAPAERDTWFLLDDSAFMAGYRSVIPDYIPSDLAYRFYLLNRYFEDWLGFVKEILADGSEAHRAWNLRQLRKDCLGWLRPLVRG